MTIPDILTRFDIKALNSMQEATIKAAAEGDEVILRSPTGSGKTLAFLLSVWQSLKTDVKTTQALIIVPSRELAQQVEEVWKRMGTGLKVSCCYGGHKREIEEQNLVQPPAIIIGTPGRLADHIRRGSITVSSITTLVLDEFDKSLELGFEGEMMEIITALNGLEKKILTSATEAVEIPHFVGMNNPVKLDFKSDKDDEDYVKLAVHVLHTDARDKLEDLVKLICYLGARPSIIFLNHRESVERTNNALKEAGITSVFYHGGMEQQERDAALAKFRNGSSNFLVTTDLASRGLDIAHIRYIIHYHMPDDEASFTHRNGRTARMEASGTAILMVGPDETLPDYVTEEEVTVIDLPESSPTPDKPQWATLFISAGKKDKVNKIDIVGFLTQAAGLKKEDVGLIEVKDFFSFVAVRRTRATIVIDVVKEHKIKGKKVKIAVAK